jgi:hypothetical protein
VASELNNEDTDAGCEAGNAKHTMDNRERHEEKETNKFPVEVPSIDELYESYDGKYLAIYNDQIYAVNDSFAEIHSLADRYFPKNAEGIIRHVKKGVYIYGIARA